MPKQQPQSSQGNINHTYLINTAGCHNTFRGFPARYGLTEMSEKINELKLEVKVASLVLLCQLCVWFPAGIAVDTSF